jgi:hypothetical protein
MLSGRTELAETRLAVTATQIVERLRIRAGNLQDLLKEELAVDSKMLQADRAGLGTMGLDSLEQLMSRIKSDQRRENLECWRDMTHVMRDFLNAWEGFSRNAAKGRFLESLPASQLSGSRPAPAGDYYNDHYTNQTKQ